MILNFTSIAVDSFSLYSTSASAKADWIFTHQLTGLKPFLRCPLLYIFSKALIVDASKSLLSVK